MLLTAWLVVDHASGARLALAAGVSLLFFSLGLVAPRLLVFVVVVWLAALGLIRRLVTEVSPISHADYLLLVVPIAVVALLLGANERGAFREKTTLAKAVAALSVLLLLGAANPLQGGPAVGLAGLLLVFVPTLWFWIGRGLRDDRILVTLFKLIAALGIAAALYGLAQTFLGFPGWDTRWIRDYGYAALNVNGTTRSFSSFSAASEYATFLGVAVVAWLGFGLRLGWIPLTLASVALLGFAEIYQSSRGIVFTIFLAVGLMAAAWRRLPLGLGMAAGGAFIVLVPFLFSQFVSAGTGTVYGGNSALVSHQVGGLADPLNPETSTLVGHLSLLKLGLSSAIHHPVGIGVGAVTQAGSKFGGLAAGTETDPSNVATGLGIPGLLAYLFVLVVGFRRTYVLAAERRDRLALVALGVLAVTVFQWLNGGQYAVAFLPWLMLGWVDRVWLEERGSS